MKDIPMPDWIVRGKIDEVMFCLDFLCNHRMIYVDGTFYSMDGRINDEGIIRKWIYDELEMFVSSGVSRRVDSILGTLRLECSKESLPIDENIIHTENGTFRIGKGFMPVKQFCRHRLPVRYNEDAPEPKLWLAFLEQLLEPDDILTLQEFMGYCLIPTNAAQRMLIITGQGGEGKSRIGTVMKSLLGTNMNQGSLAKVEMNPFARADLEHILLMVDDDMKLEALKQTHNIKSIITADIPVDLERKGIQSYQGSLYCRFMAFGNGTLQALYDHSYGFFRRQIILSAKKRDPRRVDDPFLSKKLFWEREGIFMWALAGLYRLKGNDFRFTISEQARKNLNDAMGIGNNIQEFLSSEGYIVFDERCCASSRALHLAYTQWCDDNGTHALGQQSFFTFFRENATDLGLVYTRTVPIGGGRKARGFQGIRVCPR